MNVDLVSLVIPGRNCASTIGQCLGAVAPRLQGSRLGEIIFVDDGSTDETARIVSQFPVVYLRGTGQGPGSARNLGWRAARHPLVWFVDSDCVAEPEALDKLVAVFDDPHVGGVSGSYGIMNPDSLLTCLIHQEIVQRHMAMPHRVNFLATFNVVYRREALEKVGGFDERYLKAQDAELSFRVMAAGYGLRFVIDSRVKHFHPARWLGYLATQRQQGYWRVWLHLSHRGHAMKDSYSSIVDHAQPPLAVVTATTSLLWLLPEWAWIPSAALLLLIVAQVPLTARLVRRLKDVRYTVFAWMSFVRAFWRGLGMMEGVFGYLTTAVSRRSTPVS